jgi:hypothetical protein
VTSKSCYNRSTWRFFLKNSAGQENFASMEHEGSLQYSQKSKNGTYPEALQPKSHISKPVFKMEFNACSPK